MIIMIRLTKCQHSNFNGFRWFSHFDVALTGTDLRGVCSSPRHLAASAATPARFATT